MVTRTTRFLAITLLAIFPHFGFSGPDSAATANGTATSEVPQPIALEDADVKPKPKNVRPSDFPGKFEKAQGFIGACVVEFTIGKNGAVLGPQVVRSGDPSFNKPALSAISKWKFSPAMKNGAPVECHVSMAFIFTTRDRLPEGYGKDFNQPGFLPAFVVQSMLQ